MAIQEFTDKVFLCIFINITMSTNFYEFKAEQKLPIDIQRAWDFFSAPANLALITPPYLGLKTLTTFKDEPIYNGMLIDYVVRPLFGIPVRWKTEICEVNEPYSFTDRQLKGPYKTWIHRHDFIAEGNQVLMIDTIKYELPF